MKKPKPKLNQHFINYGTEEEMELWGYELSMSKTAIIWFFILITLGLLRLVLYWKPNWLLLCTHKQCPLHLATKILLKVKIEFKMNNIRSKFNFKVCFLKKKQDKYKQFFIEDVKSITKTQQDETKDKMGMQSNVEHVIENNHIISQKDSIKYFINKRWKYVYNQALKKFERLK
jgi:hypothetical protein